MLFLLVKLKDYKNSFKLIAFTNNMFVIGVKKLIKTFLIKFCCPK